MMVSSHIVVRLASNLPTNKKSAKGKSAAQKMKLTRTQTQVRATATELGSAVLGRQPGGYQVKALAKIMKIPGLQLSPDGMCFLKCAFASPDFSGSNDRGIPDGRVGVSLLKSFRSNNTLTVAANERVILLQAPIPGFIVAKTTVSSEANINETTFFDGITYDGFSQLFDSTGGNGSKYADQVDKFRLVSNSLELVPTTNQMRWAGSIRAFKVNLNSATQTIVPSGGSTIAVVTNLTGMQAINSTSSDTYCGPSNLGVFINAYNKGSNWDANPIFEGIKTLPNQTTAYSWGLIRTGGTGDPRAIPGFQNGFETNVIIVDNPSNNDQTFILRGWQCVEFSPLADSNLYSYAKQTASKDPAALFVYQELTRCLPVAVSYYENAKFWDLVSSWIKRITGVTRAIPGPYGMISAGIHEMM